MKYIFVDLDNTLIYAEYLVNSPPKNSKVITLKSMHFTERYWGRIRPGAIELLNSLRRMHPTYMLTAANTAYARGWNKEFNLGFKEEDIYTRDDCSMYDLNISEKFPEKRKTFLIDDKDIPYQNTGLKEYFLNNICKEKLKVIVIKPYHGHINQSLGLMQINEILGQIN